MVKENNRFRKLLLLIFIILIVISLAKSTNVLAIECSEFEEGIFWNNCPNSGSIEDCDETYYTWNIKNECPGAECFIKNIKTNVRISSLDLEDKIGYAQISNICYENPSEISYSDYLVYQEAKKIESAEFVWDCGDGQSNNVCTLTENDEYNDNCFSVKVVGDERVLVDIVRINYTWCWDKLKEENLEITQNAVKDVTKENKQNLRDITSHTCKQCNEREEISRGKISFWRYSVLIVVAILVFIFLKLKRKWRRKKHWGFQK